MKQTLVTLLCLLAISSAGLAQTTKGRWTVGTQIGNFSYQNQNGLKSFSGNLTPSAGYFLANGLVVGTGVPLSLSTQKNEGGIVIKYTSTSTGLAPFIRYFFGTAALKPYLGVSYSYSLVRGSSNQNDSFASRETTNKGHSTALVPTVGLAYFFNRTLALTGGLSYNIAHTKQQTDYTNPLPGAPASNTYESNGKSVSLAIGLQIFLGN